MVIEGGRAKGVEIIRKGVRETVWAECEIILCGGTVNSPQLLMLSGVGPALISPALAYRWCSMCRRSGAICRTTRPIRCVMRAPSR
jgi:hypothetical protein